MMENIDEIPDDGAVFTFGRSRFADNISSKFWIRNDKIALVACGDEHSAIVTERGRLYTFGSNDWGQLGHGHTKVCTKPTSVKGLKSEKVLLVACGRTHTLAATVSGKLFSFGAGGDGQLGHNDTQDQHAPRQIESLPEREYKTLACGVYHSAALTVAGELYTWGSSSEGENGHRDGNCLAPQKLDFRRKVVHVSCGYYHTGVITDDGKIYMFGENENGKLGLSGNQLADTSVPQAIQTKDKYEIVACGARHTSAVTRAGTLHTFGDGVHGQLGHGTQVLQCDLPTEVSALRDTTIVMVSVGECHTAVISDKGKLYIFGDGRHGKLAQGDECFSNLFTPCYVKQFKQFQVRSIACGGCHTLVMASKRVRPFTDEEEEEDEASLSMSSTMASMKFGNNTTILSNTSSLISPRDRRRLQEMQNDRNDNTIPSHGQLLGATPSGSMNTSLRSNTLPKLKGFSEKETREGFRPMPVPRQRAQLPNSNKLESINAKSIKHAEPDEEEEDDEESEEDVYDVSEDDEEENKASIKMRAQESKAVKKGKKGDLKRGFSAGKYNADDDEKHGDKSSKRRNAKKLSRRDAEDVEDVDAEEDNEDDDEEDLDSEEEDEEDDDEEDDEEDEDDEGAREGKRKKGNHGSEEVEAKKEKHPKKKSSNDGDEKENDKKQAGKNASKSPKKVSKRKSKDGGEIETIKDDDEGDSTEEGNDKTPESDGDADNKEKSDKKDQKAGFFSFFKRKKNPPSPQAATDNKVKESGSDSQTNGVQKSGVCNLL